MPAIKLGVLRRLLAVLVASALAVAAGTSITTSTATAAYCDQQGGFVCENLAFSNLSPPVGTSFQEGHTAGGWMMNAAHGLEFVHVRLATSPDTGTDGHTLSDLFETCCGFSFSENGTNDGVYTGQGLPNFLGAGTYYWQMEAIKLNAFTEYQPSIYWFVVTPKPSPPTPTPAPQPSPTPTFSNSPGKGEDTFREFTSPETEHQTTPHCRTAHICGKTRCLQSGQSCAWRYRKQYRRYHFACVRKGSKFRLVRVAH
jgi:hypothetical protein